MGKTIIIGPSVAGKSVLLASLEQAAFNAKKQGWDVSVKPLSGPMAELFSQATDIIKTGIPPIRANLESPVSYEFKVEVRNSWLRNLLGRPALVEAFKMVDGPGGVVFGNPDENNGQVDPVKMKEFREKMVSEIRQAEGLILCVDATESDLQTRDGTVYRLFKHLPTFLFEAGALSSLRRVAICLNKVDKHLAGSGENASKNAENSDILKKRFKEVMPAARMHYLDATLPKSAEIIFGWTSAYGFLPSGASNCGQDGDGLAMLTDKTIDRINGWRPFQVLDPFVFMITGKLGGFQNYPRQA